MATDPPSDGPDDAVDRVTVQQVRPHEGGDVGVAGRRDDLVDGAALRDAAALEHDDVVGEDRRRRAGSCVTMQGHARRTC